MGQAMSFEQLAALIASAACVLAVVRLLPLRKTKVWRDRPLVKKNKWECDSTSAGKLSTIGLWKTTNLPPNRWKR